MANQPIRPGALAAAAVVAIGVTYFMVEKSRKCTEFSKVWGDPGEAGGLYLQKDVIEDALHWTREKLRSIILSGGTPNRASLHEALAAYIADCDWEKSKKKTKGRQVWDSLGGIVNTVLAEYNKDPEGFMTR